jgi:CRP-like cAMP-binding protein
LEKLDFLSEIPEFQKVKHFPKRRLISLTQNLVMQTFIKGSAVFNEGEPNKYVYIVKTGEFQITRRHQDSEEAEEIRDLQEYV